KCTYAQANGSFKIDIRSIYDSKHNEHDLLASEIAKNSNADMLDHDLSKLLCEAKDNLDAIIQATVKTLDTKLSGWFFHVNGLQGRLGAVYLVHPGLRVAVHHHRVRFPKNLSSLGNFKSSLSSLFTMMFDVEQMADKIRKSIDMIDNRRRSFGIAINRQDSNPVPPAILSSHTRPTYYSPPRNEA
ncbi:hypothetical protein DFQ28_000407, partial [Apophysomyces sp. BC1034]